MFRNGHGTGGNLIPSCIFSSVNSGSIGPITVTRLIHTNSSFRHLYPFRKFEQDMSTANLFYESGARYFAMVYQPWSNVR